MMLALLPVAKVLVLVLMNIKPGDASTGVCVCAAAAAAAAAAYDVTKVGTNVGTNVGVALVLVLLLMITRPAIAATKALVVKVLAVQAWILPGQSAPAMQTKTRKASSDVSMGCMYVAYLHAYLSSLTRLESRGGAEF
eukprot:FR741583.1.p1 GENE.FR741583.1~~FR741583.1.p1  ORF type:complete len:138 (+),score=22.38 FR741583.1:116-529(+)